MQVSCNILLYVRTYVSPLTSVPKLFHLDTNVFTSAEMSSTYVCCIINALL